MGLIVNQMNPWGEGHKCGYISTKIVSANCKNVTGDEFYILSTPEREEERLLSFVVRDKEGASILISTLETAIHQLNKLLEQEVGGGRIAEPEILPSAIEAICSKLKKAADTYCKEYPHSEPFSLTSRFEAATRAYGARKRVFNDVVQDWIKLHGELPDWAKETIAYQLERGFTDPVWKTWGITW